jgi:hypothetical protein
MTPADLAAEVLRLSKINVQLVTDFNAMNLHGAKQDARITALEAQIAAADRLADAARRASHATTNDGITGPIYTDEAVALQRALAAYRAARVLP